jgi:hypothetical protein
VATDREGAGVDLDLEEDDAFEREWRLGQRGEGGRRREGKERGHQSRAGAGSELKVKDPGGDGDGWRDETGMRCGEGEATGKGGRGTLAAVGRRLYIAAAGLVGWEAGLPASPCRPCRPGHLARARAVPWARPAAQTQHWASCCAVPWAMPKVRAAGRACGPWAGWKSIAAV